MKKYIFVLCLTSLLILGCDKETNVEDKSLVELKELVENNSKLIEELETKIISLEEEKKSLTEEIKKLQENDNSINTTIDSKYSELKTLINKKPSSSTNQYTITKSELLGTWKYNENSKITFTDENLKIYDNWFEWDGMSFSYMYKDGKLYLSDDGIVATK